MCAESIQLPKLQTNRKKGQFLIPRVVSIDALPATVKREKLSNGTDRICGLVILLVVIHVLVRDHSNERLDPTEVPSLKPQ